MATNPPPFPAAKPESSAKPLAGRGHTIFLLVVLAAWSTWGYIGAQHARAGQNPHRIATYILTSVWEWAVVGYIAWGVRRHGYSFWEVTGQRWKSGLDLLKDWGMAIGFWLVAIVILAVTSVVIHMSRNLENTKFLLPESGLETGLWVVLSVTAGICEEIIFRGYFQKQFLAWTASAPAAILLSAIVFGAGHVYQSGKAAIVITVYGILFGLLAHYRQALWPGMIAHAWHDTISGLAVRLLSKLKPG